MYGIYVESPRCVDYARALVTGAKRIETRTRNVFKSIDFSQWIAVIRTGRGRTPEVVGFVRMRPGYHCPADRFQDFFSLHCVQPGSKFDTGKQGKWFYDIEDYIELIKPVPVPKDHVNHGRSYTEFTL